MKIITNINQLDMNGSYTYADYLQWQFKERVELIKGKILKMSPAPNRLHQTISINLSGIFWNFFNKHHCSLFAAPFDVRLVKKITKDEKVITVVQPDFSIVCDASKLDDRGCNGAPDLVVEILSPGNTKKDLGIKFDLYEKNGVKEYWIIDPTEKNLFIYTAQNGKFIGLKPFTEDDKIKSPLFPNLNFPLANIYG